MLSNGEPLPLGKTFRVLRNHDFGGVEGRVTKSTGGTDGFLFINERQKHG